MNRPKFGLLLLIFTAAVSFPFGTASAFQQPSNVVIKPADDGWQMLRNGKPYYINGAGCGKKIGDLAKMGANSVRTWSYDENTQAFLDDAHAKGLSVTFGIWLGHERHGVDYQDFDAMVKQKQFVLDGIRKFKDHPAILMWGIGNEMEGPEGDNPAVWSHIESLANEIKKIDPNHPVITVIAEVGGRKVEALHELCPSLDAVGINSYGGCSSLLKRYRELGGTKPVVVTEFGPLGTWEVGKNNLGAILEPLPHEKADFYRQSYSALKAEPNLCLGSYAFLWGDKQEGTATWFGMLLPSGERTAVADTMSELWSGKKPANVCPKIDSLQIEGGNEFDPEDTVKLKLSVSDPENDTLSVKWVMTDESGQYITYGDKQAAPKSHQDAVLKADSSGAEIRLPQSGGLYRIYAYVNDGQGGGAVANLPVRVKGPVAAAPGEKAELPFVVYSETFDQTAYTASGYMGETTALKLDPLSKDNPKVGEHCLQVKFDRADNWGGVVWQSPADDWGDQPGGYNLSGAKKMTFWVRGNDGGEEVTFGFGLIGQEKPHHDSAKREKKFTLGKEWQQQTIDLAGADLQRIKTGFYFSLAANGKPVQFWLDDIKFE